MKASARSFDVFALNDFVVFTFTSLWLALVLGRFDHETSVALDPRAGQATKG
jgi:hypothetical protein